jgi:eukaryotic-like serine/threonine-protein kinase
VALAPGTRIGADEVVALLGTGGMGEVYRARDTRRAAANDRAQLE